MSEYINKLGQSALTSATGSIISNSIGSLFSNLQRKEQVKAQKDLMNYQNQLSLKNLTESPLATLKGLKSAGLSTATLNGQMSPVASSSQASVQGYSPSTGDLGSQMSAIAQAEKTSKEYELLEQEVRSKKLLNDKQEVENQYFEEFQKTELAKVNQEIRVLESNEKLTNTQKKIADINYRILNNTQDELIDRAELENINLGQTIKSLDLDNKLKVAQMPLQLKLMAEQIALAHKQGKLAENQARQCIATIANLNALSQLYGSQKYVNDQIGFGHMQQNTITSQTMTGQIIATNALNNYNSQEAYYKGNLLEFTDLLTRTELTNKLKSLQAEGDHTDAWRWYVGSINQLMGAMPVIKLIK